MKISPFLIGKIIDLRPLSASDIDGNYVNWLNDAEICQFNSHHTYPYTVKSALDFIVGLEGDQKNLVLAIVAKDTGKHIGNISLQKIDYVNRSAEYAILLGEKEYWGKGIAKEASMLIIRHGFDVLNLHRIYCGTSVKNIAMQKLADALKMKEEGKRKESLYKNGKYVDVIEYGLLRKDFK
jgi:RimJ/RimL family protein N-acetyltransferase